MNQHILDHIQPIVKAVEGLEVQTAEELFPAVTAREHLFIDLVLFRELEVVKPQDIIDFLNYEWASLVKARLSGSDDAYDTEWRKYRLSRVIKILKERKVEYLEEGQYDDPDLEPLASVRQEMQEMVDGFAKNANQQDKSSSSSEL